jgi:serine protease
MKFAVSVLIIFFLGSGSVLALPIEKCLPDGRPWTYGAIDLEAAWAAAGSKSMGVGTRILDIDTGIDRDLKDFNGKIENGILFGKTSGPLPYDYFDEVGHGTTVAGILVGEPDKKGSGGIAPRAKLIAASIGIPQDPNWDSSIHRAVRWGIQHKVDVINIEVINSESSAATPEIIKAYQEAYDAGIAIIQPSGNGWDVPLGYQARLPTVISVGALDSDFTRAPFSQFGPELGVMAPAVGIRLPFLRGQARNSVLTVQTHRGVVKLKSYGYVRSPVTARPLRAEVQLAGTGIESDFVNFVSGNFAIIQRTKMSQSEIVNRAVRAGARAIIFVDYLNELSTKFASVQEPETAIPVVFLDRAQGNDFQKRLAAGEKIIATLEVTAADHAYFAGTSGAAPVVAGVVALMKAVNPALMPAQIYQILRETATPVKSQTNEFGSGVVNAHRAVLRAMASHQLKVTHSTQTESSLRLESHKKSRSFRKCRQQILGE